MRAARDRRDLIRLPTGDGMALVFRRKSEAPVECALELGAALKNHRSCPCGWAFTADRSTKSLDVNERANLAGAGIDVAQRVMDCGDAGHILLSKRVADDLAPYPRWHPHLHDLGETEVKHGMRASLFNLWTATSAIRRCHRSCEEQHQPRPLLWVGLVRAGLCPLRLCSFYFR